MGPPELLALELEMDLELLEVAEVHLAPLEVSKVHWLELLALVELQELEAMMALGLEVPGAQPVIQRLEN